MEKQNRRGFFYVRRPSSLVAGKLSFPTSFMVLFVLFLWGQESAAQAPHKDLPMLVAIKDLLSEPNAYDDHRVVVAGRIRSLEFQTGRRGSEFIMILLEETDTDAAEPSLSIEVISLTVPKVRQGDYALVQGTYHLEGKQAGRSFERFIDADTIVREKSKNN